MPGTIPIEDRRETVIMPASNTQYVIAVMAMMMLGVVSIVILVVMRPNNPENVIIIGLILGFLAPTTLSLLALMKSQETHLSVNSRLDAFVSTSKLAAHAQGVTEGRQQGRVAADERTDTLADRHISHVPLIPPIVGSLPLPLPIASEALANIEKNTKETAENTKPTES